MHVSITSTLIPMVVDVSVKKTCLLKLETKGLYYKKNAMLSIPFQLNVKNYMTIHHKKWFHFHLVLLASCPV